MDIAEQAIMACELMEAKEELRKLRDSRDENVRMINDAKFSLMRSEYMQSSTISDSPARSPSRIPSLRPVRSPVLMHPNRHQELDISLDEHVLRDMESVNSAGHFSLEDKADAGGRRPRRWQEKCRAAEEEELVRVRAELCAAQERIEELEGANLLLASRLQGKDEVVAAPGPPRRRGLGGALSICACVEPPLWRVF